MTGAERDGMNQLKIHLLFSPVFLLLACATSAVLPADQKVKQPTAQSSTASSELSIQDVKNIIDNSGRATLIDIRDAVDFEDGHIAGAINIPREVLERRVLELIPDKTAKIVVYCTSDKRSPVATRFIMDLGYINALDMKGGFDAWQGAKYPVEKQPASPGK